MYPFQKHLFLIIILLSLSEIKTENKIKITDESFPEDSECEKLGSMLIHHILTNDSLPGEYKDIHKLLKYSGTGLNDLGDYYGCLSLNYSIYYTLELSLGMMGQSIGFCYFKKCNQSYFKNSINKLIDNLNSSGTFPIKKESILIYNPEEKLKEVKKDMKVGSMVTIIILLSLTIFCLIVTISNKYNKLKHFSMFNIEKNAKAIFTVRSQNKTIEHLRVFDGVRLFSACWICYGHLVIFPISFTRNLLSLVVLAKKWSFAFLIGALYAVDVFFFLSGFLFYFFCQDQFNKKINKIKTIFIAFLNRYLRLLPFMLFTVFAITYLLPYFTSGPLYFKVGQFNNGCRKNFWIHFLYINNLNLNYEDGCAAQTWYLGCDMQFFVVSILIVFIFNNSNLWRQISFGFLMIGSIVLQMYKYIKNKYGYNDFFNGAGASGGRNENSERGGQNRGENFYTTPYARIGPYLMGIYFSMIFMETPLYKREYCKKKKTDKENKIKNINVDIGNEKEDVDKLIEQDIEKKIELNKEDNKNENEYKLKIEEKNDIKELIKEKEEKKEEYTEENPSIIYRMNVYLEKNDLVCYILFIISLILLNYSFWTSVISAHYKLSVFTAAFMNTFNKLFFTLGLAIILHLTFLDKLTFIKNFLSLKIMSTVSRGTYGIYMIHMYFIFMFICSYGNFYYLKLIDYVIFIIGIFTFSWAISFVIGLIIESPVIGLSKMFVKKRK